MVWSVEDVVDGVVVCSLGDDVDAMEVCPVVEAVFGGVVVC